MFSSTVIAKVEEIDASQVGGKAPRDVLNIHLTVLGRKLSVQAEFWDKVAVSQKRKLKTGLVVALIGDPTFSVYTKNSGENVIGIKFRNPQIKHLSIDENEEAERYEQMKINDIIEC